MQETISIIIPAERDKKELPVLRCLSEINYPKDKLEVVVVRGNCPPAQRNKAVQEAKGDILCFFNSDSQLEPDMFNKIVDVMGRGRGIAGVGGPDLTPADNSYIQRTFGYAMGSYFAHWKMRARYVSIGKERFSSENELLLSNLAVRRDVFLKAGGFNERLYPNEENELINRISKMGYKFVYHPDVKVYRDRRKTLSAFMKQFYRYGRGRMDQIFIEGISRNLHFFIPLFFLVYLVILPFTKESLGFFVLLFAYIFFAVIDAIHLSLKNRRNLAFVLPVVYLIVHVSYGAGILAAICNKGYSRCVKIKFYW